MGLPAYLVDAFTSEAFAGNPAGVVLLDAPRAEKWMQAVAREMNQAETAFALPREQGYDLRWFTPAVEVDLCGHATLATAHVLWEENQLAQADPVRFHTRSGILAVARTEQGITMDFPATPPEPAETPPGLLDALGLTRGDVLRSRFDYLVVMDDPAALRKLTPTLDGLRKIKTRGVIVTCPSDRKEFDFLSRFFGPQIGVDEDPVTGSAHCALAPYWAGRLGRNRLTGFQASPRGGVIGVEVAGDRVLLSGTAVTVLRASLAV